MEETSNEETVASEPPRKRRRWPWITLLTIFATILLVLGAARVYLTDARLREIALQGLRETFLGEFELERASWRFPNGVLVQGFEASRSGQPHPDIAVERVEVRLNLFALLDASIDVTEVTIDSPTAHLSFDDDWNLALLEIFELEAPGPEEPESEDEPVELPLSIFVRELSLRDGHVVVQTPEEKIDVSGIDLLGRAKIGPPLRIEAEASVDMPRVASTDIDGVSLGPDLAIHLEGARFAMDKAFAISVERARVTGDQTQLDVRGRVGFGDDDPLSLNGKVAIDIDFETELWRRMFEEWLPPQARPRGALKLDAEAEIERLETGEARIDLRGRELRFPSGTLEGFEAKAGFRGGTLSLADARLTTGQGRVGLEGRLQLTGKKAGAHEIRVELDELQTRALGAPWVDPSLLPGRLGGQIRLSGDALFDLATSVEAQLDVVGLPTVVPKAVGNAARIEARADVGSTVVRVLELDLSIASTQVTASGRVPIDRSATWDLHVDVDDGGVRRLVPFEAWPRTTLGAQADLSGPLDRPAVHFESQLRAAGAGRLDAQGDLVVSDEVRIEAALDVSGAQLSRIAPGVATGSVSVDLSVSGPVTDLSAIEADGRLRVTGARVAGIRFSRVDAGLEVREGKAGLRTLVVEPEAGGRLVGQAVVGLESLELTDTELSLSDFPLGALSPLTSGPFPASGVVSLAATAKGSVSAPQVDVRWSVRGGQVQALKLGRLEGSVVGGLDELRAKARLDGALGTLQLDARARLADEQIRAELSTSKVRIGPIAQAFVPDLGLAGELTTKLQLQGRFAEPKVTGRVQVEEIALFGDALGRGIDLRISTSTGAAPYRVDGTVLGPNEVAAKMGLIGGPTVDAQLHLVDLPLGKLIRRLDDEGISARVGGEVHLEYGPDRLAANAQLDKVDLAKGPLDLSLERPFTASYSGSGLSLSALRMRGAAGELEVIAGLESELDLRAKGRVELALVNSFIPQLIEAEGPVGFDGAVTGTLDAPRIEARVRVDQEVRVRPRAYPRDILLQRANVDFSDRVLRIEKLVGAIGRGQFEAEGQVELSEAFAPESYAVRLSAASIPFRTPDLLVEADADIELKGAGPIPDVSGRVVVVQGRFLRKFRLRDLSLSTEPDTSAPLQETAPELADMHLDIKVQSAAGVDVYVDVGSLKVDLNVTTDLRVSGTPLRPRVSGRVAVPFGTMEFPAGDLDIATGSIDFIPTGAPGVQAEILIQAEGSVENRADDTPHFVTMRVEGDLEQMQLDFTSDPALDAHEVLLLLLTGYAGSDGEGDGRAADAALAMAGSQVVGPVADYFSDRLDDVFNLGVRFGAELTSQGVRVTAKKDITRRIRLESSYTTGAGDSGSRAVARARFYLLDRLFFESSFEQIYGSATTGSEDDESQQKIELKVRVLGH